MSKASKHKQQEIQAHPAGGMAAAGAWLIHDILLSKTWNQPGELVTALVARRSPRDRIAGAAFLIDLACLGVKSVTVRLYKTIAEYNQELRGRILATQPMEPASLDLVATIVETGRAYAEDLGFRPDPVLVQARPLLSGANLDTYASVVPTGGPQGKPLFVAGPYDDVDKIVAQLTRRLGAGNFDVLLPYGGPLDWQE